MLSTVQWRGYTYERIDLLLKWCFRETRDAGKECLRTNYHGTKQVIGALLPLLLASDDGRVVNVSSELGQLRLFGDEALRRELDDVEALSEERVDAVVAAFARDLDAGAAARGWPAGAMAAYTVSKAALNDYSRVLARRHPALRVNCVHPGFVRTDMTVNFGLVPPEEGAARVVAEALLPAGAYFQDGKQAPFV
uniref:NAD-dependent epimerase/dehydratase domain-containing protein n=1 Tax=Setaria italica TaxID=4555 RepID=K4AMT0_SETIT